MFPGWLEDSVPVNVEDYILRRETWRFKSSFTTSACIERVTEKNISTEERSSSNIVLRILFSVISFNLIYFNYV